MEAQNPPPLEELLRQNLLLNEAVAPIALHDLPDPMFPELFKEAFMEGHGEVLKSMVQAWPFPRLPLGALMKMRKLETSCTQLGEEQLQKRNLQTFKAVLDGLDALLAQTDRPSRWQLKVLDLRDVHGDFWSRGPRAGAASAPHAAEAGEKAAGGAGPDARAQPALTVLMHLCLEGPGARAAQAGLQACLLEWARKNAATVHVCCEKVTVESSPVDIVLKLLRSVQLDTVHELEVFSAWSRDGMKKFLYQLRKMTNLRAFRFSGLSPSRFPSHEKNKRYRGLYACHLARLQGLREFQVDDVFFLRGALGKILRGHSSLESLSLSSSPLAERDLTWLAFNSTMKQLKHLTLRNISLESFSPTSLLVLLEQVAGTLETLVLEHCELRDSKFLAILPALSLCSQLQTFSCYGNPISMEVLRVLLRVSAGLSRVTQGLYPVPWQFRPESQFADPEEVPWVLEKFTPLLRDIRPSLRVRICTYSCASCTRSRFYSLQPTGLWEATQEYRHQSHVQCHKCLPPSLGACDPK